MKLWIDDVRPAPKGYIWIKSVNQFKEEYFGFVNYDNILNIEEISLDHDAGNYASDGGDYIKILDFLEEQRYYDNLLIDYTIFTFHSANPIGVNNMKRVCNRNGWRFR